MASVPFFHPRLLTTQACDALRKQSLACQTRVASDAERDAACGRAIDEYKACVKAERAAVLAQRRRDNGMG